MASNIPVQGIEVNTPPTATFAPLLFAGVDPGQIGTDDEFYYNPTAQALAIPELTANPATSPAANSVFLYSVLSGGNYTLRIKNSAGTVVSTGNLT